MRERAQAMLDRVGIEARAALGDEGASLVHGALAEVLRHRDARVADDHDPRCLHPARTIRILLSDGACTDAVSAAAAAYVESVDPALTPPWPDAPNLNSRDQVRMFGLGPGTHEAVRAALADVPLPGADAEETLERLVTAPAPAALVALCERLDQVRHVHMRSDVPWEPMLAEVRAAWLPAAVRLAPQVARRYAHWADAFERRLLLRRAADLP